MKLLGEVLVKELEKYLRIFVEICFHMAWGEKEKTTYA